MDVEYASWEGKRRGGEGTEEDMHYLLPLKTKGGLIHQPAIPKPIGVSSSYLCVLDLMYSQFFHSYLFSVFHLLTVKTN